jgi:hypothetical protein
MRRILIPLAVLLVLGLGVQAHAASALSLLEAYQVNLLEDDDVESAFLAAPPNLQKGDLLYGMVVINPHVDTVTGPNLGDRRLVVDNQATFTGVFVLKVMDRTGAGPYEYTFGHASATEWSTYAGYTPNSSDTLAVFFSDDDADDYIDTGAGTTLASLATAQDGVYLWEFGFNARDANGRFWLADAKTSNVGEIGITPDSLSFRAALDVTHYGAGPQLLPFNYLQFGEFAGLFTDLQLVGRNTVGDAGDFDVPTDAEIYLKPTPEPGTLALLGLGLLGLGGVVYRRRRS